MDHSWQDLEARQEREEKQNKENREMRLRQAEETFKGKAKKAEIDKIKQEEDNAVYEMRLRHKEEREAFDQLDDGSVETFAEPSSQVSVMESPSTASQNGSLCVERDVERIQRKREHNASRQERAMHKKLEDKYDAMCTTVHDLQEEVKAQKKELKAKDIQFRQQLRNAREESQKQLQAEGEEGRRQLKAKDREIQKLKAQLRKKDACLRVNAGAEEDAPFRRESDDDYDDEEKHDDDEVRDLYMFIDDSNLWITAKLIWAEKLGLKDKDVYNTRKGYYQRGDQRVRGHFDRLYSVLLGIAKAKRFTRAYFFGSRPPKSCAVWRKAEEAGLEPVLSDRGEDNKEKKVDTAMTRRIVALAKDLQGNEAARKRAIFLIVSGDWDMSEPVEEALKNGVRTHVAAFRSSLSKHYKDYQDVPLFSTCHLDKWLKDITFHEYVKKGRPTEADLANAVVFAFDKINELEYASEIAVGDQMKHHKSFHGIFFTFYSFEHSAHGFGVGRGFIIMFRGMLLDDFVVTVQKWCETNFAHAGDVVWKYLDYVAQNRCLRCKEPHHLKEFCQVKGKGKDNYKDKGKGKDKGQGKDKSDGKGQGQGQGRGQGQGQEQRQGQGHGQGQEQPPRQRGKRGKRTRTGARGRTSTPSQSTTTADFDRSAWSSGSSSSSSGGAGCTRITR